MNIDKVIEILDSGKAPETEQDFEDFDTAIEIAINLLKTHPDNQPNDPLTLEQLREMDGEKIFVHYIDGFYTDEDGAYFGEFEQLAQGHDGKLTACELPLKYYGKTWLAYRRKPEDGTNAVT